MSASKAKPKRPIHQERADFILQPRFIRERQRAAWSARIFCGLAGLLVSVCPARAAEVLNTTPGSDQEIYHRIDVLRARAAPIRLDGKADDWQGIPSFNDSQNDAGGDASRDIVSVSLAPRDTDLLVMIQTKSKPSQDVRAFGLFLGWTGQRLIDAEIDLDQTPSKRVWAFGSPSADKSAANTSQATFEGVRLVIDEVVEVSIPYDTLARVLPVSLKRSLIDFNNNPWLRVMPFTHKLETSAAEKVDLGASAASYRLIATPYPLDPPLRAGKPPGSIPMPVAGKWFLAQGAFAPAHPDEWSYDFQRLNETMQVSRAPGSRKNEDYLGWGDAVYAPVEGDVVGRRQDAPNLEPSSQADAKPDNFILLQIAPGIGFLMGHLQKNPAIDLPIGEPVPEGGLLGRVGNAGNPASPQLHLALVRLPDGKTTLPLALDQVIVGINPSRVDPWARLKEVWEPRQGYFVERAPEIPTIG